MKKNKLWKIPSFWKTRGKLAVFGALKTNPGKVYHHKDKSKGCKIMLKFMKRLVKKYERMKTIYFIWDNFKAHQAKTIENWVEFWNSQDKVRVKILSLPTYSPWLNPIEPAFGDLYKKVIAGSNFRWPCDMAKAIHKYFCHRNSLKHRTLN